MLNGRGPYTFVLDSGGDYIVTPEVAAALQAKSAGGLQLQGVGSATEGASFAHVDSIAIGNAIVRDQYTLVLPIATGFGVAEGLHIDGMVGHQLLARFLSTIDYANSKLTLAMPSTTPASAPGAAAIPFYIDGSIPRISVNVDGVTTSAEVDTGSRAGLTLSSPFVAAHPSIEALAKTAPTVEGFGVGGASYARLGRIPTLQIGPYTVSNSVASFGIQTKGALADPFNPANLGGAILRRFDVTLRLRARAAFAGKKRRVRHAVFVRPIGALLDRRERCVYGPLRACGNAGCRGGIGEGRCHPRDQRHAGFEHVACRSANAPLRTNRQRDSLAHTRARRARARRNADAGRLCVGLT